MNQLLLDSPVKALTKTQIQNTYKYAGEILNNLSDKALDELINGYNGDLDKLMNEILVQTNSIINFNSSSLVSEKLDYLEYLEKSIDEQFKIMSYNYFKSTCLSNFTQHWRNLEWGNLVQLYPWSAYLCQRGSGKSSPAGTEIVMFDGFLKRVEDVVVGDKVMGKDSTSRTVLSIHSGYDDMYEIKQANALTYGTNSRHILHFKRGSYVSWWDKKGVHRKKMIFDKDHTQIVEMSTKEFHQQSRLYKMQSFGYRVEGWDLSEKIQKIDPYFLGLWLGDGSKHTAHITNIDKEIIDFCRNYALELDCICIPIENTVTYTFQKEKRNPLNCLLKEYNLLYNKHIPSNYLLGSRQQRLQLLAGLIDSDGTTSTRKTSYSITQKDKFLLEQIQQLCWSLGFRANLTTRFAKMNYKNNEIYTAYTLHFSGHIWEIPCKVQRKIIKPYNRVQDSQRSKLESRYVGLGKYYGFELDGDHLYLLKDGTTMHNSYEWTYAFPAWRLWSYKTPHPLIPDTKDNMLRKETCLITNESRLGALHFSKIIEEIKLNDILGAKLNPNGKATLGVDGIRAETGSVVHRRSFDSAIRGLHVGASITDDFLNKSCLYSLDQRNKFKEVFSGEIKSIVDQGGYNIVDGTPFHQEDLYGDLMKDPMFKVFTYPGILPDMELLAPDRFTFQYLMDLKTSLGTIVFSREILVSPISDSSSLFPYEYLMRSTIGMENIRYVENIESFPIKMERVVIACDFAISGAIGADSSAFVVLGRDSNKNIYLIHYWRKRGASHNEQVSQITGIDSRFKPNVIIVESNGFQSMLGAMVKQRGSRNVKEFVTESGLKKDLYLGLPSLSAFFERGQLRMPYAPDEETQNKTHLVFSEFNGVTFNPDSGKLENTVDHDDLAMAIFIGVTELREKDSRFKAFMV